MYGTTINNRTMQRSNYSLVLRAVYDSLANTRRRISALLGLTPSAVTNMVSRFIEDGYIVEAGSLATDMGRKPIQLEINDKKTHIVGVELSSDSTVGVLTGFCGNVRHTRRIAGSTPDTPPEARIEELYSLVYALLDDEGLTPNDVLGVGIASAGPYDRERGIMLRPPNFNGWNEVPIRDMAEARLGMPVLFDRDAVVCLVAERCTERGREYNDVVAVLVNMIGIGGSAALGGSVYYGRDNSAFEIGHVKVAPEGPLCGCGGRGCLEAVSSGTALLRDFRERTGDPSADMDALVRAYRAGESAAVAAVEAGAGYVGLAVGNVIETVAPEAVIVGGSFRSQFPEYYDAIERAIRAQHHYIHLRRPDVTSFSYGDIQCAMGAAKLVICSFFDSMTREGNTKFNIPKGDVFS